MNYRSYDYQQFERYLSTFGKKVLDNLVNNLKKRNECNKTLSREKYNFGQNKRVLNFGDSYISPPVINSQQSFFFKESYNNIDNNKSPDIDSRDINSPVITKSQDLVQTNEREVTEIKDVTVLTVNEDCNNGRKSDDVCVQKDYLDWDNIFDTQLLNDLNVLDTDCNTSPQKTSALLYNNHEGTNISKISNINKRHMKRPSSNKISSVITKKVKKNLPVELPKKSFRKQTYTKTIKTWLTNVEHEAFKKLRGNKKITVEDMISEKCKPVVKKNIKNTVQAQLTNKGGVMKYAKPKQMEVSENLENPDFIDTNSVRSVGVTVKEKKRKPEFIAPIKSQIPLKNVSYNIINLDDRNFKEYVADLTAINDKEINMILKFSNEFCQLNSHHTEDTCVVEGAMFELNKVFYYWASSYKGFCKSMENVLNHNTVVCYDAKSLLKYFASQRDIDLISTQIKVFDVQIGGNLIDPYNPPENFTALQKILSFVPEYTIAAECAQQKCAWYLTMLGECFIKLKAQLIHYDLWNVFVDIEMPVLPIVAVYCPRKRSLTKCLYLHVNDPINIEMERRGVRIDTERLRSMENCLLRRMQATERACHAAAGRAFQLNSAMQVRKLLYDELRLDIRSNVTVRETQCKGDKSTSESMLRNLMAVHPLPRLILEYRHAHKAHATFLAGIANQVKDGFVSPKWEQIAAVTGRIACNNPNLQAIPKAPFSLVLFPEDTIEEELLTEANETLNFRSVYIPSGDHVLLAADFKHIECRVFAYAAADTSLLHALASPDLFKVLAAKWLNKSEEDISSDDRERTKRMVYASLYGAGTRRLMEILGVTYDQTLAVVASFNRTFPSLKSFGRNVVAKCEQRDGRLTTLCGRGRTFRNMFSADFALKSQAQRQAINFIVQGSAADLCKLAMVATERRLRGAARLLLQIHDELVWEVRRGDVPWAAAEIKLAMEGIGNSCGMALSLPVAVSVGRNWGEMEEFIPTPSPPDIF